MKNPEFPSFNEPVLTPMSAFPFIPDVHEWDDLATAAAKCKGCPLYARATQTVFGVGPRDAKIFLVGEQPGDQEDKAGKPFVGPAGHILDKALADAGINREDVYVTNAVKHFKWEPSPNSDRRIHARPNRREVEACKPWLQAEIEAIRPERIACLGATAAQALLGDVSLSDVRGQLVRETSYASLLMVTVHPSSIVRLADDEQWPDAYEDFVKELRAFKEAPVLAPAIKPNSFL